MFPTITCPGARVGHVSARGCGEPLFADKWLMSVDGSRVCVRDVAERRVTVGSSDCAEEVLELLYRVPKVVAKMLLILMTLCLGVSGGRLGDCLLHKHAEDSSSPAISEEVITSDAEIISVEPEIISDNDNTGSGSTIIPVAPNFFPSSPGLPNFAPNPALFNQDGENIPVPSTPNIRRQEDGKQVFFSSSVPFAGGVSSASFSSVGSYQGPQGGFVQFSQPLAGFQVGYNGAHLSPPVVVCLSWCLDPTGNYFCCRYTGGQCPLEPDTCPAGAQPTSLQLCSSDFNCGFGFKCCFDRCSERFVCKAAVA